MLEVSTLATMYILYTHKSIQKFVNINVNTCEILVVLQSYS